MQKTKESRCGLVLAIAAVALSGTAISADLEVGSPAPPLRLPSADGGSRALADIDGPRVLVFYRGLW